MHSILYGIIFFGHLSDMRNTQMSNYVKGNQKHLTLSDRIYIEQELAHGSTFRSIAAFLEKDPSTISKEVHKNVTTLESNLRYKGCKQCNDYMNCQLRGNCGLQPKCKKLCKHCSRNRYRTCSSFLPFSCIKPAKPSFCNGCSAFKRCYLSKSIYIASKAQRKYETTLKKSREGINLTVEELRELNELVSPLIIKGQPLSHIFATHAEDIPCCRRTLYNYLDQRVFQARNIDLPRRVRYKKRRKTSNPRNKEFTQTFRHKRTYRDFQRYVEAHPDEEVVEMDTVKGGRASGKCLLTLLFRKSNFMLIILLPKCNQVSVINAMNSLTEALGVRLFRKTFPILLTDNGSEFKNPHSIEHTVDGKRRTRVYYCDPYVSNQRARLEKNHEYIRYFIPKGRSMFKYTQEDISLMASHINSTARDSLNGKTPFDLANLLLDKKVPLLTGLNYVSPDKVMLKPALIEK